MNRTFVVVVLAAALACGGTGSDADPNVIEGSGVVVTQPRAVQAFHGVRLESVGHVVLSAAAAASVEVEADDNVVDRVRTRTEGGVLVIGLEPGSYRDVTLIVRVAAAALDRVELTGAGTIEGALGDVARVEVVIEGAGDVTLTGAVDEASVAVTGAGAFHGYDLVAAECTAELTGTGIVEVTASESLDARVTGVGCIRYGGAPAVVRSQVSGVGSIEPRS